jgi:pSer/pThr/pTyr-binding forkhead associated (FHA) protein
MDYDEPEWSQAVEGRMAVECFKAGMVAGTIDVPPLKKFLTIGRLPDNDVPLEHESVSRRHAVLQFGPKGQAFLYDLNSTHGTFVNKQRIPPVKYVEVRPGNDQFSLGASTRTFYLHFEPNSGSVSSDSPDEDLQFNEKAAETEDDESISSSSSGEEPDVYRQKRALTAEDLGLMLENVEAEVLSYTETLTSRTSQLAELEEKSADDFDAYILSLKKDELEQDVERYTKRLEEAQKRRDRITRLLAIAEPDFVATSRPPAPPSLIPQACEMTRQPRESRTPETKHSPPKRANPAVHTTNPSDNDSGDDESASKLAKAYGY